MPDVAFGGCTTLRSYDCAATGSFHLQPDGTHGGNAILGDVGPDSSADDSGTLDLRWSSPGGGSCRIIGLTETDDAGFDACKQRATAAFETIEKIIPCFTPGTLIATIPG